MSIRTVSELWKGRKNDFLIAIRQQEKETQKDLKALGIRIPVDDMKNLTTLTKEVLSMLYVSSELKGIEITEILREIISQINNEGQNMVREVKQNLLLK
jgi:predicted HAD superfamily phosphohydrolase